METLPLDEIGDLPLPLQAKLWESLKSEYERWAPAVRSRSMSGSGSQPQAVEALVKAGQLREDLYYPA